MKVHTLHSGKLKNYGLFIITCLLSTFGNISLGEAITDIYIEKGMPADIGSYPMPNHPNKMTVLFYLQEHVNYTILYRLPDLKITFLTTLFVLLFTRCSTDQGHAITNREKIPVVGSILYESLTFLPAMDLVKRHESACRKVCSPPLIPELSRTPSPLKHDSISHFIET